MLIPVLLKLTDTKYEMEHEASGAHGHFRHGIHLFLTNPTALTDMAAIGVHTLSMFLVMGAVAVVV